MGTASRTTPGPAPDQSPGASVGVSLPREEIVLENPEDCACPCWRAGPCTSSARTWPSGSTSPRPASRSWVTRRPKYACRGCAEGVVQAPAPERLIEGGIPTERLVAHVLAAKYAVTTCPCTARRRCTARQGVQLDRSTLADWVGRAAFALKPVHARLLEVLKASAKLFADETWTG